MSGIENLRNKAENLNNQIKALDSQNRQKIEQSFQSIIEKDQNFDFMKDLKVESDETTDVEKNVWVFMDKDWWILIDWEPIGNNSELIKSAFELYKETRNEALTAYADKHGLAENFSIQKNSSIEQIINAIESWTKLEATDEQGNLEIDITKLSIQKELEEEKENILDGLSDDERKKLEWTDKSEWENERVPNYGSESYKNSDSYKEIDKISDNKWKVEKTKDLIDEAMHDGEIGLKSLNDMEWSFENFPLKKSIIPILRILMKDSLKVLESQKSHLKGEFKAHERRITKENTQSEINEDFNVGVLNDIKTISTKIDNMNSFYSNLETYKDNVNNVDNDKFDIDKIKYQPQSNEMRKLLSAYSKYQNAIEQNSADQITETQQQNLTGIYEQLTRYANAYVSGDETADLTAIINKIESSINENNELDEELWVTGASGVWAGLVADKFLEAKNKKDQGDGIENKDWSSNDKLRKKFKDFDEAIRTGGIEAWFDYWADQTEASEKQKNVLKTVGKIGAYTAIGIVWWKFVKSTWNVLWGSITGKEVAKKDRGWLLGGLWVYGLTTMTSGNNPWELNKISKDLYTWIGDNGSDWFESSDENTDASKEMVESTKKTLALSSIFQGLNRAQLKEIISTEDGKASEIDYEILKWLISKSDNADERLKLIEKLEEQKNQDEIMKALGSLKINEEYLNDADKQDESFDNAAVAALLRTEIAYEYMEENDLVVKDKELLMAYHKWEKDWDDIKDKAFEKKEADEETEENDNIIDKKIDELGLDEKETRSLKEFIKDMPKDIREKLKIWKDKTKLKLDIDGETFEVDLEDNKIKELAKKFGDNMKKFWEVVFVGSFIKIREFTGNTLDSITEGFNKLTDNVGEFFKWAWEDIKELYEDIKDLFKELFGIEDQFNYNWDKIEFVNYENLKNLETGKILYLKMNGETVEIKKLDDNGKAEVTTKFDNPETTEVNLNKLTIPGFKDGKDDIIFQEIGNNDYESLVKTANVINTIKAKFKHVKYKKGSLPFMVDDNDIIFNASNPDEDTDVLNNGYVRWLIGDTFPSEKVDIYRKSFVDYLNNTIKDSLKEGEEEVKAGFELPKKSLNNKNEHIKVDENGIPYTVIWKDLYRWKPATKECEIYTWIDKDTGKKEYKKVDVPYIYDIISTLPETTVTFDENDPSKISIDATNEQFNNRFRSLAISKLLDIDNMNHVTFPKINLEYGNKIRADILEFVSKNQDKIQLGTPQQWANTEVLLNVFKDINIDLGDIYDSDSYILLDHNGIYLLKELEDADFNGTWDNDDDSRLSFVKLLSEKLNEANIKLTDNNNLLDWFEDNNIDYKYSKGAEKPKDDTYEKLNEDSKETLNKTFNIIKKEYKIEKKPEPIKDKDIKLPTTGNDTIQ